MTKQFEKINSIDKKYFIVYFMLKIVCNHRKERKRKNAVNNLSNVFYFIQIITMHEFNEYLFARNFIIL